MSGFTNYPTALDDDTSLYDVSNLVTAIDAGHHNNIKEAVKAIERRVGIENTAVPTSIDYRLGNASNSHRHDGASGQGQPVNPTTIPVPSGGYPAGGFLYDHLMNSGLHSGGGRFLVSLQVPGSIPSGLNRAVPLSLGRTMRIENIRANLKVGPTAATIVANVKFGPTSLWQASAGNRPMFAPVGATNFGHASPNLVTYPSGAIITVDIDQAVDPELATDLSINLLFRE